VDKVHLLNFVPVQELLCGGLWRLFDGCQEENSAGRGAGLKS
jgi:hypothetical protein